MAKKKKERRQERRLLTTLGIYDEFRVVDEGRQTARVLVERYEPVGKLVRWVRTNTFELLPDEKVRRGR